MNPLEESAISCPYCGETLEILIEPSVDEQQYIEDCQVCCKPMVIRVVIASDGAIQVEARHEDEA